MDDKSYFTVDGNEWQQQSLYESEDHPVTENVKFIRKTKFSAKVLLWLAVGTLRRGYVGPIRSTKNKIPKGRKFTKRPTDTAD
jgi:hypothetical protein